jgi:2-polyprenyl-3-methyl-5-hydroxy-6-metoxy-1,4-benzoquinol methylase
MNLSAGKETVGGRDQEPVLSRLEAGLTSLILEAIEADYTASPHGVETGNRYQSVTLGRTTIGGFRGDRAEILDRIDFAGKTVLDLGSNLGELSRAARERGARLVDGFELDPFFIKLANLLNASQDTTRVSFHRKDIRDPATYDDRYDLVLAFSVWGQGVARVLPHIADITEVLVLETHKLEDNLDHYLTAVSPHFERHLVLGTSDWGAVDARERRAIVLFTKKDRDPRSALIS